MCTRSLDQEDPLEKGLATRSSILAWRSPWTEESGRLQQSIGSQRVGHDRATWHTVFLHLNIRTRKLSQPPYPVVSWIFSIAIDKILGFKKNWIQGLKLNDILSLPLLSFLCLTLFSLLCFPLALVSGWFSVINGKMSMLNGIRFSSPQKSLQKEQRH